MAEVGPPPISSNTPVADGAPVVKAVLAARYVQDPSQVLLPFCTGDPFLITSRPPNSAVLFRRAVSASLTSTQLDFFGIGGANRDYMSVANNANSDLLVHLGFDSASASNFTERVKPGDTFRLGLSWILYGGPVQGIWLPPAEAVGPVKYAVVNKNTSGSSVVVPAVAGARIRVLNYLLTATDEIQATWQSAATTISGPLQLKLSTVPMASGPLFETVAGEALNLSTNVAKLVTGHVAYVEVTTPPLAGDAQVVELL